MMVLRGWIRWASGPHEPELEGLPGWIVPWERLGIAKSLQPRAPAYRNACGPRPLQPNRDRLESYRLRASGQPYSNHPVTIAVGTPVSRASGGSVSSVLTIPPLRPCSSPNSLRRGYQNALEHLPSTAECSGDSPRNGRFRDRWSAYAPSARPRHYRHRRVPRSGYLRRLRGIVLDFREPRRRIAGALQQRGPRDELPHFE